MIQLLLVYILISGASALAQPSPVDVAAFDRDRRSEGSESVPKGEADNDHRRHKLSQRGWTARLFLRRGLLVAGPHESRRTLCPARWVVEP